MKTNFTFSILIWINTTRAKNNMAELFARVTVNYKRTNISLKRKACCGGDRDFRNKNSHSGKSMKLSI